MAALDINARLVCNVHSGLDHRLRLSLRITPADALRAFMHVQDIADAMARSALIIHIPVPHGLPCQNVQVPARAAIEKSGVGKRKHADGDCGEMLPDFIGNGSEHNRSGHIRGSSHILSAGIHQKHSFRLQLLTGLGIGLVMHHGCVFLIAADGGEGKIQIAVDPASQSVQILRGRRLGNFYLSHIFLQPVDKFAYGGAVLQIDLLHVGKFHLVLDGLHQLGGILPVDGLTLFLQRAVKGIAGIRTVKQYRLLLCSLLQEGNHLSVGKQCDAVFCRMSSQRIRHLTFLNEQVTFRLRQIKIGKRHRIAGHIRAPDVQKPHQIVQLA